jgi:hypothetical protein
VVHKPARQASGQRTGQDERHGPGDCSRDQSRYMTGFLVPANDFVLVGNYHLAFCLPADEYGVVDLQKAFTGHAVQAGASFFAFEWIVKYDRN